MMNEKQPENGEHPFEEEPQTESENQISDLHTDAVEEIPDNLDADEKSESSTDDWDDRTLCSDGSCIGIIGTDGKCKECGKPYDGFSGDTDDADDVEEDFNDEYEASDEDFEEEEFLDEDSEVTPEEEVPEKSVENEPSDSKTYWKSRTLCSDGSCIGVIGPDGRCKECGKSLEG